MLGSSKLHQKEYRPPPEGLGDVMDQVKQDSWNAPGKHTALTLCLGDGLRSGTLPAEEQAYRLELGVILQLYHHFLIPDI